MKIQRLHLLGMALRDFFGHYLQQLRGMSSHTILSYRDSLKLLLTFVAHRKKASVSDLGVDHLGVAEIIAFLDHLETHRKNGIGTRNIRLSAIHSFFRFIASSYPEYLDQAQRVLSIPFKRMPTRTVEYLEFEEIGAVLEAVDRSTLNGKRDYLLLALLFNTGARVQEIVNLKSTDLELSRPFSVRICGKGRKERVCPLWPETAHLLREYIAERGIDLKKTTTVFTNHLQGPLTRFGVRYILAKYLQKAAQNQPSLKKNAFIRTP
jgi:site-specific recombinase XerD